MEHPAPTLPLVPDPVRVSTRRVRCPDCSRIYPLTQQARYALHWRVMHGRGLGAAAGPEVEQA